MVDTRGGAPVGGPVLQAQETRALAIAGHYGIPAGFVSQAQGTVHLIVDVNGYYR